MRRSLHTISRATGCIHAYERLDQQQKPGSFTREHGIVYVTTRWKLCCTHCGTRAYSRWTKEPFAEPERILRTETQINELRNALYGE